MPLGGLWVLTVWPILEYLPTDWAATLPGTDTMLVGRCSYTVHRRHLCFCTCALGLRVAEARPTQMTIQFRIVAPPLGRGDPLRSPTRDPLFPNALADTNPSGWTACEEELPREVCRVGLGSRITRSLSTRALRSRHRTVSWVHRVDPGPIVGPMETRQLEGRGCRLTDMTRRGRIRTPLRDARRIECLLGPLLTVKTDGPGSNLSYSITRRGSADGLPARRLLSDVLRMRSLSSAHFVCSVHDLHAGSVRCLRDRSRRDHTTPPRQGTVPTAVHRQPAAYTCM